MFYLHSADEYSAGATRSGDATAQHSVLAIGCYALYQALPRDAHDADAIFTVTYKNMAALDTLQVSTEPAIKEVFDSTAQGSIGCCRSRDDGGARGNRNRHL
jgi:hypothetical protein